MGKLGKAFAGALAATAVVAGGTAHAAEGPTFTNGVVTKLVPTTTTSAGQVGLTFHEKGLRPAQRVQYSFSARMRGIYVGPWQYLIINHGKDLSIRRDHGQIVATFTRTFTARADRNGVVSGATLTPPLFTPLASTPNLYWVSIWSVDLRDVDNGVQDGFFRGRRYRNVCNKDGEAVKCTGIVVT